MDLPGAAQNPAHEFRILRKHPAGHRRARRIAIENGVAIDPTVTILREREDIPLAGTNAHASYLSRRALPDDLVRYQDLFPDGRVFIRMHRSVFLSDEAIVAHLVHELFEIRELEQAFSDAGGRMLALDLFELIREGKKGNLHDRARDEANRVVEFMRVRGGSGD
jgi:hypothetical protein